MLKEILTAPFTLVGGKDNFTTFVGVNYENNPYLKKEVYFDTCMYSEEEIVKCSRLEAKQEEEAMTLKK